MARKSPLVADEARLKKKVAERRVAADNPKGGTALRALKKRLKRVQRKRRALAERKRRAAGKGAKAGAGAEAKAGT
jgi:hypothetical protein